MVIKCINLHVDAPHFTVSSALSHLLQVHLILTLVNNTVYVPGHSASILGQTECLIMYSNDKI